nr:TPM domain-containing protein [Mycobacterium sp. Marseille-P9652]
MLTVLAAGFLATSPAGAQPPFQLTDPDHITDNAGALTGPGRAAVSSAIDRLYRDRHIQLWVVYVDNFSRFKPENWAAQTRTASGMSDHDALLAVATNTKAYTFTVPPAIQGLTPAELDSVRTTRIEPAVNAKDWSLAAIAAAHGLDKPAAADKPASSPKRSWLPIAIGVLVVVLAVVAVAFFLRARHRRRASGRLDAGHGPNVGHDDPLAQALSTADARVRQISDYVARHRESIGADARARLDEAKRYWSAAQGTAATQAADAIAYANRASTLAAQAQSLANADVLGAHRAGPRRRATR